MQPDSPTEYAAIRSAAWWVRWYARPHQLEQRESAIRALAETALATGKVDALAEALRLVLL